MHAEAGIRFGPGLVAGDIPDQVPGLLTRLLAGRINCHDTRPHDTRPHDTGPDRIDFDPPHPDMFDIADIGARTPEDRHLPEDQKL